MSAYLIFIRERIRDEAGFAKYGEMAGASMAGHPIEPLVVYGAIETLEGPQADGAVVVRFPDAAAARAWYDSPAYVEAREQRFKSADYRVVLVEGIG